MIFFLSMGRWVVVGFLSPGAREEREKIVKENASGTVVDTNWDQGPVTIVTMIITPKK